MGKKGPASKGPGGDGGTSSKMQGLSIGGQQSVARFPPRPPRTKEAPGKKVRLLTNLLAMSITQAKPIYKYPLVINAEKTGGDKSDPTNKEVKISSGRRREIVKAALRMWVQANKPKDYSNKLEYNYAFDANGSVVYTLFNMFPSTSSGEHILGVGLEIEDVFKGKMTKQVLNFQVKISSKNSAKLNLEDLFKGCKQEKPFDIIKYSEITKVIQVLLHERLNSIPSNVVTKTSVFPFKKENQCQVSHGVLFNKGYSLSARAAQCGIILNVANTGRAFYEPIDLVDMLSKRFFVRDLSRPLSADVLEKLKKELVNKQVEATHYNYGTAQDKRYRKYRVTGFAKSSLDEKFMFVKKDKDVVELTINAYFKQEYNYKLKYPQLPCINSNGRKLPFEVCRLVEKQGVLRKMTPDETAKIITLMATPPQVHFDTVKNNIAEVQRSSKPLNDFGLTFSNDLIEVEGRELLPFRLVGGGNREITPNGGQYNVNNVRFYKPVAVKKWILVYFGDSQVINIMGKEDPQHRHGGEFSRRYCEEAKNRGVSIPPILGTDYIRIEKKDQELKADLKAKFDEWNKADIDHVIIILPDSCQDWIYRYIQYLEAVTGRRPKGKKATRTSCIKFSNYLRKIMNDRNHGRMFISNLWLKHNTKLGGINFILGQNKGNLSKFLDEGYIFISVDVCHPAPGDKLIQSVAACVALWDLTSANLSCCTRMRVQKKTRENHSTIEEVGEIGVMVEEVVNSYRLKKGKLPSKVVILRDGVSEGQYRMVLESELLRISQRLFNQYARNKQPMPPITCFVVQKRHKIRFKLVQPAQGFKGPDYNIQPGTVVDSTITHPTDHEFYLAAHKAIQGTSRPPRFYVICDQIKFDQDEAQAMVHALSYLSPRCTKSTSIPTPVNLADLAAERGKNIVISWNDDNLQKMNEEERLKKLNEVLMNLGDEEYKHTLYYV